MRQCIVLPWGSLKTRARFTGEQRSSLLVSSNHPNTTDIKCRFRDIGYQHIPYFNCPKSLKCSGCVTGRFTDGERFLFKEDCRPNWFKYVGKD